MTIIIEFRKAIEEYAKQERLNFFNWVVDTFTTDEARLPLSGNQDLGRTIFIEGEEYPISKLNELYLKTNNHER